MITIIWTANMTYLILKITSYFTNLRVHEEEEIEDLDQRYHGERAYSSYLK